MGLQLKASPRCLPPSQRTVLLQVPALLPGLPQLSALFLVLGHLPAFPSIHHLESLDSISSSPNPPPTRVPRIHLWLSPPTSRPPPARVCRPEAPQLGPRRAQRPCGFSSAAGAASEPPALAPCPGIGGGAVAQCPGDRSWRAQCPPASARQKVAF